MDSPYELSEQPFDLSGERANWRGVFCHMKQCVSNRSEHEEGPRSFLRVIWVRKVVLRGVN